MSQQIHATRITIGREQDTREWQRMSLLLRIGVLAVALAATSARAATLLLF